MTTPLDCCEAPRHLYVSSDQSYHCATCGARWTLDEYSELMMNERAEQLAAEADDYYDYDDAVLFGPVSYKP